MTLYGLERFLARLAQTVHADDFCLKGGVLLSAHALRRPTRDVDMQILDILLDVENINTMVAAVAVVEADDGLTFDLTAMKIEEIRDEEEYSGLRVSLPARLASAKILVKLDISTGDPIWPEPEAVELPSLLGEPVRMMGHPLVTVVAEKSVTMSQRGITSTRWRDLLDVGVLSQRHVFGAVELGAAIDAVAEYRGVQLSSLRPTLAGYGEVGQRKWAAWRRKLEVEDLCRENLDDQVLFVLEFIDPIFAKKLMPGSVWSPQRRMWT